MNVGLCCGREGRGHIVQRADRVNRSTITEKRDWGNRMIQGASLLWLKEHCEKKISNRIVIAPRLGLEMVFLSLAEEIIICAEQTEERALMELLWVGMCNMRKTGLETLLGLNKAGRRVFLYHQLRSLLGEVSRRFWDENESLNRTGILFD